MNRLNRQNPRAVAAVITFLRGLGGCGQGGMLAAALVASAGIARAQTGFVNWESPHVSPLALVPGGGVLLAVNTADNRLEVFDLVAGEPVWRRSIAVGLDPVSVRVRSATQAWVVNHLSDNISIVDLPTGRVVRTVSVGDEPADVAFALVVGGGERAFITLSRTDQILVLDANSPGTVVSTISVAGQEPRMLAVSPDGSRIYTTIFESGNRTGSVRLQDVNNVNGPYGGRNPAPNNGNVFDPPLAPGLPPAPPGSQIVKKGTDGRWMDDNNRDWSSLVTWNVVDNDVAIVNPSTLAITYAGGMMTHVMALGVRADGRIGLVGTESRNEVRFEPNLRGTYAMVQMGSFAGADPSATNVTDLNPHLTYATPSIPAAERLHSVGDPRGVVWHPSNGAAYVSGMGSNNVIIANDAGARLGRVVVGEGPTGLAMNSDGSRLYVLNKFDGSISTLDTSGSAGIATELSRVAFFDPTPHAIRAGRPLLYNTHATSGLGQVSCATCHIDARTDSLAWDLGDPRGQMKAVNQPCRQANCRPWHPMKGPMVTQTLQGIVNAGSMHWRGDRENVRAFSGTYVSLMAADAVPSTEAMVALEGFIASVVYQPNPNLNLDGTFPAAVAISGGGNGAPANGRNLYITLPVLAGGATCNGCHALPRGTSNQIDDPRLPLVPQAMKTVQLRGMWEKSGWSRTGTANTKLFGFNHDSEFDTMNALLQVGFNFGPANQAPQGRRDVEAFMICFPSDTHAGVGQQVTFDGGNNNDPALLARLNTFINLANQRAVGLVAKGRVAGVERGYYLSGGVMVSDQSAETNTPVQLRQRAAAGSEMTFTLVAAGTQRRIGVERDGDGYLDGDEVLAGSSPADPASAPPTVCASDFNVDGGVDGQDVAAFFSAWEVGAPYADINHDGGVDGADVTDWFGLWQSSACGMG